MTDAPTVPDTDALPTIVTAPDTDGEPLNVTGTGERTLEIVTYGSWAEPDVILDLAVRIEESASRNK